LPPLIFSCRPRLLDKGLWSPIWATKNKCAPTKIRNIVFITSPTQGVMRKPRKFRRKRDLNPDLCDANVVLYELTSEANWELVVMWVNTKLVDDGHIHFLL